MSEGQVALITGASSGIGLAIAELLASQGFRVFGASRHPEATNLGYGSIRLDVRDDDSVRDCIATIVDTVGRIDVVVNNAVYALLGAIEETSIEEAKAIFETNFFGAVRVTATALPYMRAAQYGRIINIGVVLGFTPQPFGAFLASAKHALAGYSTSLAFEVKPFGIEVSLVEPGFVKTNQVNTLRIVQAPVNAYDEPRTRVVGAFRSSMAAGMSPRRVAGEVLRLLRSNAPKRRRRVGGTATMLPYVQGLSPTAFFEGALRKQNDIANGR